MHRFRRIKDEFVLTHLGEKAFKARFFERVLPLPKNGGHLAMRYSVAPFLTTTCSIHTALYRFAKLCY